MPYYANLRNDVPLICCCRYRGELERRAAYNVGPKLLYRVAFTVWHVALYLENQLQVNAYNTKCYIFLLEVIFLMCAG